MENVVDFDVDAACRTLDEAGGTATAAQAVNIQVLADYNAATPFKTLGAEYSIATPGRRMTPPFGPKDKRTPVQSEQEEDHARDVRDTVKALKKRRSSIPDKLTGRDFKCSGLIVYYPYDEASEEEDDVTDGPDKENLQPVGEKVKAVGTIYHVGLREIAVGLEINSYACAELKK